LHQGLKAVLGDHISQRGSLVDSKNLRFDFSHFSKLNNDDLKKIERFVNLKILANIELEEYSSLPLSKAKELGAVMLFGEKYEDNVRMIQFGDSKELCGGTHVNATGEIGLFKITSEGSVSAGIRRVHAITGFSTLDYIDILQDYRMSAEKILSKSITFGTNSLEKLKHLVLQNKMLNKEILLLKEEKFKHLKLEFLPQAILVNGVRFLSIEMKEESSSEDMKKFAFLFRNEENLIVVLGLRKEKKALLSIVITDDLVKKGLDASSMISVVSKEIGGGGGGQQFFATAGGKNQQGILLAFEKTKDYILNCF
jgi:alanyl-tRNA synthetase